MNGNGLRRFSLEIHRARPRRAVEESPSEMANVRLKRGLVPDGGVLDAFTPTPIRSRPFARFFRRRFGVEPAVDYAMGYRSSCCQSSDSSPSTT